MPDNYPDLALNGNVPVLYWCQDDADNDEGRGFNVHLANSAIAERFATLGDALDVFKELLRQTMGVAPGEEAESSFVLTNAPVAYDYGYTTDLGDEVQTERFTLRTCIAPDSHVDYQIGRYQSGLYVAFKGATYDEACAAARAF